MICYGSITIADHFLQYGFFCIAYNLQQNNLHFHYEKKLMDANVDIAKHQQLNEICDVYVQRREVRHEYQREARNAKYTEICVVGGGDLILETKNSWINVPKRQAANFKFLGLFPLTSSDGESGISAIFLEIKGEEKYVYVKDSKVGRGEYFLRKITAIGGQVFANSKSDKENILRNIWAAVYPLRTENIVIPTHLGWISCGKNQFEFVKEGTKIWQDYVKLAK